MATDENIKPEKYEQYEQKVAELRAEAARLLSELESYAERAPSQPEALTPPRDASAVDATGQPLIAGQYNSAADTTYLDSQSGALYVFSDTVAVTGVGAAGVGSTTGAGLKGISYRGYGVEGFGAAPAPGGVHGVTSNGYGVHGESTGDGFGVYGASWTEQRRGQGVFGGSVNGVGVMAFSREQAAVSAISVNGDAIRASTNSNSAAAIVAESSAQFPGGTTIVALGQIGIGLYASGSHAAVQLGRAQFVGPPTTGFHEAGEIMLDANADLYLCKATGSPGTWSQIG